MSKKHVINKKIILVILYSFIFSLLFSQTEHRNLIENNDTLSLNYYCQKQIDNIEFNNDSSLYYGSKALVIAQRLNQKFYQGFINCDLAYVYIALGDYTSALKYLIEATRLSEDATLSDNIISSAYIKQYLQKSSDSNRRELVGWIKNSLGILYGLTENQTRKLNELLSALQVIEGKVDNTFLFAGINANIVECYLELNKVDSALYYQKQTMKYEEKISRQTYNGVSLVTIGNIYLKLGKIDLAKKYLSDGIRIIKAQDDDLIGLGSSYISLANLYKKMNQPDSGIYFAKEALNCFKQSSKHSPEFLQAYKALSENYATIQNYDSAYHFRLLAGNLSDSINDVRLKNMGKFHSMGFNEKLRLKDLETESIESKSRSRITLLFVILAVMLIIAIILFRNNKAKQIANQKLEKTLAELRATQIQLVQSEKMASLGELTAGIAHEIQNPLNFVNNFSELNLEMIEEMKTEISKGNFDEVSTIAEDIIANEIKINHHGKRADAIVKGMLQHSRQSTGKKEPTYINELCDEYLRLSYHGLRAKDKSFNARFETHFDPSIGKIDIVTQDIGRVILNIINNAFYAVTEKAKSKEIPGYEPGVIVSTKKSDNNILISIKDNGSGIPPNISDKIFQPFFTTKPTGQGTGLGLSLSYDIVKAHGGEIKVNTRTNSSSGDEGTEFIIELPLT